jgi:oligoribonuclease
MADVVRKMHTTSGLLQAIERSTLSLSAAGEETLAFVKSHVPEARTVPLAGNSIGTDRRFLATWLPQIDDWLHYRSVDVSTIKELVRRWYPDVYAAAPAKRGSHRALDDIRESIAELQYYRTRVFIPGSPREVRPPGT